MSTKPKRLTAKEIESKHGVTLEQQKNLRKLAKYLFAGNLAADFDMFRFSEYDKVQGDLAFEKTDCGTVGCAVGHGPYAGIEKEAGETWFGYSRRVFGAPRDNKGAFFYGFSRGPVFRWLFDADWKYTDNTSTGAAERIAWFLQYGLPSDYNDQVIREAPPCYSGTRFETTFGWCKRKVEELLGL